MGLAELPPSVRGYLREGLSALGRLTDEQRRIVSKAVLEAFSSRSSDPFEVALPKELKVGEDDARSILAGATFLAGSLSTRKGTPQSLLESVQEAKLIDPSQASNLLLFVQLVDAERVEIEKRIDLGRLESEVLPKLDELDVVVDLRIRFVEGKPDLVVPIALFHIDTDGNNQEIWFQATKSDVERMVKQLKDVLERMESTERWASQR